MCFLSILDTCLLVKANYFAVLVLTTMSSIMTFRPFRLDPVKPTIRIIRDNHSRIRSAILFTFVCWSASLFALLTSPLPSHAIRLILGRGEIGYDPAIDSLVFKHFSPQNQINRAYACYVPSSKFTTKPPLTTSPLRIHLWYCHWFQEPIPGPGNLLTGFILTNGFFFFIYA